MPFEPNTLFPGLLSESATRVAQDAANHPGGHPAAALISEMGWNAVLIPEAQGGAGGDLQDLAAIIEGLATHAVNLPVVTRCGVIPAILSALPKQPSVQTMQTGIAEGALVVELGGPLHPGDPTPALSASKGKDSWLLSGTTTGIELTDDCTHVLLIGRDAIDNKAILICVATEHLSCSNTVYRTMDDRQIAVFDLDKFPVRDDDILASGAAAAHSIHAGWRIAAAATATDSVCSMGSALSRTISYLLERKQFGHALADFQALRHDVARLYVTYELCRSLLQATLRTLEQTQANDADTSALDLLGLYIGQEAIRFAETVIQLHGGMGMTREMPAAQLATRLLANALRYGDPLTYEQKIHHLRSAEHNSFSHGVNTQVS
ncbi:acyl-CoA dehydrogenase family protein [Bordetella muralis]|uniref:acyl-CoA dehydrogenase family protein n=1 Tax=Bordetella muralis TaxID=1649130 RepID=UPI0039EE80BC